MNYIIDGHNLIGKLTGLDLHMIDDEQRLIELLNHFGQFNRGKLEVYFDGAPVGEAGASTFGRVRAHFVAQSQTADDAIRKRLNRLGKSARNWVVVTSDHSVQAAAHETHARVMKAEEFAMRLNAAQQAKAGDYQDISERKLSEAEIDEWLAIFKARGKHK